MGVFFVALLGAVGGGVIVRTFEKSPEYYVQAAYPYDVVRTTSTGATVVETPDFISASAIATPAVVHVKSFYSA